MSYAYFDIGIWESAINDSFVSIISLNCMKTLICSRYSSLCLEASPNYELKIIHIIDLFLCTFLA